MYETILITVAVVAAGTFLARRLYRILSGQAACQCSAGCLCSGNADELKEREVSRSSHVDSGEDNSHEENPCPGCSGCRCCMNGACPNSRRFQQNLEQIRVLTHNSNG